MKITTLAIKRGISFFMIYLLVIGFGIFSLAKLRIDLFPDLTFPIIAVLTQYTGVNPYDIETTVTRPLEETVSSVENVKKVSSITSQGLSLIILEFDWGTDMDQAEIDARRNIDMIRDFLPDDVMQPMVFAFDPSMQPVEFLAVNSNQYGLAELRRISEMEIEPRLERIPGVANAFTVGGLSREIKVLVDPHRLQAHRFSIDFVINVLRMNNMQLPSGFVDDKKMEFTVQTTGEFSNLDQIRNTTIANINGTPVRVQDVAQVVDGFKEQRQREYIDDIPSVLLMVSKQSDANTVQVCSKINNRLESIRDEIPKGVEIVRFWDQSEFINRSMSNLGQTAIQAIGLAFLVLLFFMLNFRSAVIIAISIPTSLLVTFSVMDQAGLTLNMISMAGLALAVGLLVDNSIVVLENIFRRRQLGNSIIEAADKGGSEVSMAITASTLTTLAVFVPVLFVPGIAGELFKDMVVTICFSLLASLIVALTLVPLLASRFLVLKDTFENKSNVFSQVFTKVKAAITRFLSGLKNTYSTSLGWAINHRKTVIAVTFVAFVLSIIIFATSGADFFPHSDQGFIIYRVNRAPGTSLDEMDKSMKQISKIIQEEVPEAENIRYEFGQGEGFAALFGGGKTHSGEMGIKLVKLSERKRRQREIDEALKEKFKDIPGVEIKYQDQGMSQMFGEGDIVVEIFGFDLVKSKQIADQIKKIVEKIPGTSQIEISIEEAMPELKIELDRNRISDLGLSTAMVSQTISSNLLGTVASRYREGGDEFDIRVQVGKKYRQNKKDIENLLIVAPNGARVPLRAISKVVSSKAPTEITREDQERVVKVSMMVTGRDLRGVTKEVEQEIKKVVLPRDYRLEISGMAEEQQESFMYLGIAMIVAILLTYMVMASQFESMLDPFVILFTIPLSLIGVAIFLFVTGTNITVMALIGIIMLVGIVVNNGIVLVDYMNQLRQRGKELIAAVQEGGETRMRPVLMTALTTILAMVPLALGLGESGENWAPLARSVIGGLFVATFLTLFVVPVIYIVVERKSEKFRVKREAKRQKISAAVNV
ncbi:efflux RND transporter permease subunit [candidate division KSB1 bacterium]|nr:efflux RND transporter permease subunit [candidate division KSB1 bacterium]